MVGSERGMVEYDEESVLLKYLWEHCQHLMTVLERRANRAILARAKAASAERLNSPKIARMLREDWGCAGDAQGNAALAAGEDAFRRRVCQRVLSSRAAQASINRCPRCHRVVRTPKARQCFWCGNDWHDE